MCNELNIFVEMIIEENEKFEDSRGVMNYWLPSMNIFIVNCKILFVSKTSRKKEERERKRERMVDRR